jgi:uncharacterized membrane protein
MSAPARPRDPDRPAAMSAPATPRTGARTDGTGPARRLRAASAAVALIGLAIAGYLTAAHYTGGAPVCAVAHGCATVQQSAYAELAGVPVALLGLLGYAAILATLVRDGEGPRTAAAFLSLGGAGFSAWLTYVEVYELEAICVWCVGSAVCMALLAALSVARLLSATESGRRESG